MKSNLPETPPDDVLDELERARPRLGIFGRPVHWFGTTSSTNDVAAKLAERGADEGTTVVAEAQTAGRGRMGRVWFSPPGAGLYVSVILRPPRGEISVEPSALLTIAAGLALAEGLQTSTGLSADIKWPNDLIVGRRKLAGILAEAAVQGDGLQFVILGIGVNLRPAAYPPELRDRVTSLESELGRPADRALILAELLAALALRYADLRHGRFDAILNSWRRRAPWLRGSLVEWDSPGGVQRGRAEDIDRTGALLVHAAGRTERLIAGEVRWI